MVPKCKMEAAVGSGYRVVTGLSLELALLPPLRTEVGLPGPGSSGGVRQSWAELLAAACQYYP